MNKKKLSKSWLFSANKTKSSESFSKQPAQLIIAAHNCHKNVSSNLEVGYQLIPGHVMGLFFRVMEIKIWAAWITKIDMVNLKLQSS